MTGTDRWRVLLLVALVGCADGKSAQPSTDKPSTPTPQEPAMTTTDPRDPKAWEAAASLAEKTAGAPVTKKSDSLPFVFETTTGKRVVIHNGTVVTGRGPAVAGAYLRDLGVIQGKGPQIDDILVALDALDALPTLPNVDKHGWVGKQLPDLAPYVYTDGQTAQIVLHYFLGGKPIVKVDTDPTHKPQVGAPMDAGPGPVPKATARMTLELRPQGDATWKREDINT